MVFPFYSNVQQIYLSLILRWIIVVTRSSWLNCVLRDGEAVYWVSIGHYEAVAVGNWWYWVSRGHLSLYILHKVGIWTGVTDALRTDWQTLKDRATQLLPKYKSGALVTQLWFWRFYLEFHETGIDAGLKIVGLAAPGSSEDRLLFVCGRDGQSFFWFWKIFWREIKVGES